MLTVRAILKDHVVSFPHRINLSAEAEYPILITFLDRDTTLSADTTGEDALKNVSKARFGLTDKELAILKLVQEGKTNEQIADRLEISPGATRNYLSVIYEKLGVVNRTGAITRASEHGLLD